ncbi:hypothetical protein [Sulfurimonas sp.]
MKTSYKKGVLVWIDDNFLEHEFLKENSEIDKWQAIFGNFSKKIYRLLDLELKIMTNKFDFDNYLKSISNTLDTYYYFIVDLSLPDIIDSEPEVINGLEIGASLKNKNYDFCFLSSSSSAGSEMQEMGLGSSDYYVKFDNNDLLPESLRHKILFSFRNNISWIELTSLKNSLDKNSNILIPQANKDLSKQDVELAINTFPYFNKFRDFLDRTEFETNIFTKPFFIRSHPYNSFEFESQCLLIMLADRVFFNPNKILVEYDKFKNNNFRIKVENSSDNVFWAIKLDNNVKVDEFEEFYRKVKRKQIVFIVNDNESAEKFLERVSYEHTNLKDLPYINKDDLDLRNIVIQKSIQLFLNHFYKLDNKISNLYLSNPELLIHPKNIMFLGSPKLMTSNLSDSPEILQSLYSGFKNFFGAVDNLAKKQAISDGKPISVRCLFRVSDDILGKKENLKISNKALVFALDDWLKRSWKYPYGIDLDNDIWKKFSFEVLLMQIDEFNKAKSNFDDEELEPFIPYIEMISGLLNSNAVNKLLKGKKDEISISEWEDLAYLRWPHLQYPMPMYLNEILEKSDKHLWIQHKNFNFIGYSKKLILEHRKLNNMLEYYDKTISLMKNTHHYFPAEMQDMFLFILNGVEKKKEFEQTALEKELFTPLTNFMDEFLVISLLFRSTYGHTNRNKASEIKKIKDSIKVTGSYGKDIGIIDGSLKKDKPFSFKYQKSPEESALVHNFRLRLEHYIKKGYFEKDHFLEEIGEVLSKSDAKSATEVGNAMLNSDLLQALEKDTQWVQLNFKEQVELIKNSSIVDHIRQIFSQFEYFDLHFNIIKNIDCSTLLQYLASIRNKVIAHKDATEDKTVDLEYLYESFIYSYEGMLLQYQYVLSQINDKTKNVEEFLNIKTNYIQLNKSGTKDERKFRVKITNKKSSITVDKVFTSELQSLYCDSAKITGGTEKVLEIEGIDLNHLYKLIENYKIEREDVIVIDLLDLNQYMEILEKKIDSKNIKIDINPEWLK